MQFIPGLGLDAVIDELGQLSDAGRTPEPNRPRTGERVLSVALARSLLGTESGGTGGRDGIADGTATMALGGGITPDPGPLSRPDRGSSFSLNTSEIHLPGQSGSGAGGPVGKKSTYWESVARIGIQVGGALAYAHKLGVLHRDIKPANLLKVEVNAETDLANAQARPETYLRPSVDGQSVTAWVQRATNRFEEWSFTLAWKEPPVRRQLPTVGPDVRWNLHFQNHMRTALVIKDNQLHRWSAAEPGVLGPGVPTPMRAMLYGPSADARSVISQCEGRVFDIGVWPPRPSVVRFAHPGWQRSPNAWAELSPDGRFAATWISNGVGDGRLARLPRPHSRPALPPAERARRPERRDHFQFAQVGPHGASVVLWGHLLENDTSQRADDTHHVRFVDLTTGAVRGTRVRHSALVREVAFTPDGCYFATGSFDGIAHAWVAATGLPAGPPLQHQNYVATVAFSPDGKTLATGG